MPFRAKGHKNRKSDAQIISEAAEIDPFLAEDAEYLGEASGAGHETRRALTDEYRQRYFDSLLGGGTSQELIRNTSIEDELGKLELNYLVTAGAYFNRLDQVSTEDRVRAETFNIVATGGSAAGLNPEEATYKMREQQLGKKNET